MGATGAKSGIKLGIESTWGTPATLKYLLPFTSESLNYKVETSKSEAILNTRGTKAIAPGKEGVSGSIEVEAYPKISGLLFYLALGKASLKDPDEDANSGDEYIEVKPIGISEELPSVTARVNHGGVKTLDYTGLRVNTLNFEGSVGAIPKISMDLVGLAESENVATEGTVETLDKEPFYFKELLLSKDGVTYNVNNYSDIKFSISNNIDEDEYALDGTGKRRGLGAGALEITGNATLILDSSAFSGEYTKFKQWQTFELYIKLSKSGKDLIVRLPMLQITEATHDVGGKDKITMNLKFEALEDETYGPIVVEDHWRTTLY